MNFTEAVAHAAHMSAPCIRRAFWDSDVHERCVRITGPLGSRAVLVYPSIATLTVEDMVSDDWEAVEFSG